MNKFKQKQSGFTLMEMMIAMTIFAILISFSVTSYERISFRTSIRSLSNEIEGAITQARISAMTNGDIVSVCPALDIFPEGDEQEKLKSKACESWATFTHGTADNQRGFIIFKDPKGEGRLTEYKDLIARIPFDDRNDKVGISSEKTKTTVGNASTTGSSGSKKYAIRFTRKGMLASTAGTIVITSKSDEYSGDGYDRGIVIAPSTGRVTNKLR